MNSYSMPVHKGYVPSVEPYVYSQPVYQQTAPTKKGNSKKVVTVAIVIALFVGVVVVGLAGSSENAPEKTETQQINPYSYFKVSNDFLEERNTLSVALATDNRIAFTLSPDQASKYVSYTWTLYDRDHLASTSAYVFSQYTGDTIKKTEPVLYYLSQKPGVYDIKVDCLTSSGQRTTYSGTVTYIGTVIKDYNWTYNGASYSIRLSFDYKEYLDYKNMNINGRNVTNYNKTVSFVTYNDPVIKDLERSLRNAYGVNKAAADGNYASFILAFVQICFGYPSYSTFMSAEKYQYGVEEYFAYPLETIIYGMGDCEDTSILAAALFKAAGFNAGVVVLPGHAVAAVGLDSYSPGNYSSYSDEVLSKTVDNVTYYGCETTVDVFQKIGLISNTGSGGHPYSWYIGKDSYDFYIVT
ncbi:hypothetical protein [Candidatus Methanoplasma termitum]|uniref:hypothetical protein n=1 Tax=Candidatus Methanoplasma termitum TaxID=1577791 RepID=UPI001EE705D8|nr:hypothetical protein [Candidatus Methanoplasma termitum]MCL2333767.1 hypothetical protein [Candidatus Methanoplasma sp.]